MLAPAQCVLLCRLVLSGISIYADQTWVYKGPFVVEARYFEDPCPTGEDEKRIMARIKQDRETGVAWTRRVTCEVMPEDTNATLVMKVGDATGTATIELEYIGRMKDGIECRLTRTYERHQKDNRNRLQFVYTDAGRAELTFGESMVMHLHNRTNKPGDGKLRLLYLKVSKQVPDGP